MGNGIPSPKIGGIGTPRTPVNYAYMCHSLEASVTVDNECERRQKFARHASLRILEKCQNSQLFLRILKTEFTISFLIYDLSIGNVDKMSHVIIDQFRWEP